MIDIRVEIKGERELIVKTAQISEDIHAAVMHGLSNSVMGIFAEALKLLNGPNRTPVRKKREWNAGGGYHLVARKGRHSFEGPPPGSYPPVSIITGHLKGRLGVMGPGETKSCGGTRTYTVGGEKLKRKDPAASISTKENEVLLYNSAAYAAKTEETRPFLTDAVKNYSFERIQGDIDTEVNSLFRR